jgi:glycosyltransferase involved in cell wall biosynthesis
VTARDDQSAPTFGALVEQLWPETASHALRRVAVDPRLRGTTVAVITNRPMHYRIRLFNELSKRLGEGGCILHVLFLGHGRVDPSWNVSSSMQFDHSTLGLPGSPRRFRSPRQNRLLHALTTIGPTIVVAGGLSPPTVATAAIFARRSHTALGLWSGEIATSRTARSVLRRIPRVLLTRKVDFGLAYGHAAGEYLLDLNPQLPVVYVRNSSGRLVRREHDRSERRTVEIVFVGQLIRRKGIDLVIDALAKEPDLDCRLTIFGDGPLASDLAHRANNDRRIALEGPVRSDRVPEVLGRADCFVFPSREDIYGLAPVEAMAAGLAVVTSASPGFVEDLVVDGENGLVVTGESREAWARVIERVVNEPALRERLGSNAASTIRRRWAMEHSANAWVAGLNLAVAQEARR